MAAARAGAGDGCRHGPPAAAVALRAVVLLALHAAACAPGAGPCALPAVQGRVLDGSGEPIAGATVFEWWHGAGVGGAPPPVRHARFAESDASGRFSFARGAGCAPRRWLPGGYGPSYGFAHPAYGLLRGVGPPPEGEPLVLRLAPEQAVAARAAFDALCQTPAGDDATQALAQRVCPSRPARNR